nr:ATP-grasp domain-containing protein [Kibdelosporangium sp. MJ126-NF4]
MSDPLVVLYDRGAATPGQLGVGLADLGPLVFAVPDTEHTRQVRPVLARLGEVVDLSGDDAADLAAVRALRPRGVVTYTEQLLPVAATITEAMGLPGHDRATAHRLTDKFLQRERLRSAGVDPARSVLVTEITQWDDAIDRVGLPAIVKPARGQASRSTFPITDPVSAARARAAIRGQGRWVVEEMLVGRDYVSVESLSGPWGTRPIAVTGKLPLLPPFRETGQFWPSTLDPGAEERIAEVATASVDALGVTAGITHTEIKLTETGPRVIEVNGRLGGHIAELAARSIGVDLVRVAALSALGRAEPPTLLRPDRVFFQHNAQAPAGAVEFVGVRGAAEVRRLPGISGYRPYVRPGHRLGRGEMTYPLDLLSGDAVGHDEMVDIISAALKRLEFEFLDESGRPFHARMDTFGE